MSLRNGHHAPTAPVFSRSQREESPAATRSRRVPRWHQGCCRAQARYRSAAAYQVPWLQGGDDDGIIHDQALARSRICPGYARSHTPGSCCPAAL